MEKIPDHYQNILPLIPTQFKNKRNFNEILKILSKQIDDIENAVFDLIENRWLDNAIGAQLDTIGKILVIDRDGRDDASYLKILLLKVGINNSEGTPEEIIKTVLGAFPDITKVRYIPNYPAGYKLWADNEIISFAYSPFTLDNGDTFVLGNGDEFMVNQSDPFLTGLFDVISPSGVSYKILDSLSVIVAGEKVKLGIYTGGNIIIDG